ncbi:50S ribosomal protein L13 [Patescibacteria group bacterium]|nr:50S ribosomal protein L13 [Patescibacteria group bacterium]
MNNFTKSTKKEDIQRVWRLVDVNGKILGRVATEIAGFLMGKSKPYFVRNLDCGDHVVVVNASHVKVTGKKEQEKKYYRHSGYPGGLKVKTFKEILEKKPEEIIRHSVMGMLPQNKLRDIMLKRLYVFPDENHPYGDKIKEGSGLK